MLRTVLLLICIIAISSVRAGVSFSGNWETAITGNGTWKYSQVVSSDRLTRVTSPVRQGQYAARVEVRPGDDPINSSGERAEVLTMTTANGTPLYETEASGTQYYAFSVRLDSNWAAPAADANGKWAIVFQLHGPDALGTSPSFAVSVQNRFSIDIHGGDLDVAAQSLRYKSYALSDSSLNPGRWVDLVIKIKFAKDFSGTVTVWRRNQGQTAFSQVLALVNIPTLQYKSGLGGAGSHYWKHGLYRSKQTTITNVLWLDGLTRGDTYDEVVAAAFGGTTPARQPRPQTDEPRAFKALVTPHGVRLSSQGILNCPATFSIVDMCGKTIWEKTVVPSQSGLNILQWQPGGHCSGFYIAVFFNQGNNTLRQKITLLR